MIEAGSSVAGRFTLLDNIYRLVVIDRLDCKRKGLLAASQPEHCATGNPFASQGGCCAFSWNLATVTKAFSKRRLMPGVRSALIGLFLAGRDPSCRPNPWCTSIPLGLSSNSTRLAFSSGKRSQYKSGLRPRRLLERNPMLGKPSRRPRIHFSIM